MNVRLSLTPAALQGPTLEPPYRLTESERAAEVQQRNGSENTPQRKAIRSIARRARMGGAYISGTFPYACALLQASELCEFRKRYCRVLTSTGIYQ